MKFALAFCFLVAVVESCTTVIVGKDASTDGSVMCTHSDDGGPGADARLLLTPAMDHPAGAMRPVYFDTEDFPHDPSPDQKPIGSIPEVRHTYARYSCTYGIMNERQVGIGETTCSAVFGAKAVGHGGKSLLSVDSLSRIALERCATARCAVSTMGSLAEEHGFYGAGSFEGSGESLMVIDPADGWIFHILPDSTGAGAIWAAQRIDDDKVGVVANMYTIREVNLTDTVRFLGSKNLLTTAEVVLKAWKPADGLLDFTKVYSDGEYAHKFYSGRRMWGAYHLLAPSLELPSNYSDLKFDHVYPAAVVPDRKVSRDDVFAVHRSYYEGTEFDMTKGLAAGAWGNPDRFNSGTGDVAGNWERSLGLFRTSHTHLVQARSWLPDSQGGLLWYAPHSAPGSCFTPFSAGCLDVAEAYTIGNPNVLDRSSAYWAHRIVFNVMQIKYSYMRSDVNRTALALESQSSKLVAELDKMVLAAAAAGVSKGDIAANLTAQYTANANTVLAAFVALPDKLIAKFADGWLNDGGWGALAYPDAWMKGVGYGQGPPDVPCPPCPCTPLTSPQCSSCCGNHTAAAVATPDERCGLPQCISDCDAQATGYRHCVRECDRRCQ